MTVTNEQKQLIQSTLPIIKEHGKDITSKFYSSMFKEHPELHNLFNETNQKTGRQAAALAMTVVYFAQHLDNVEVMQPQLSRIASKHRAMTVQPEHYPLVGKYLMQAIKDNLGDKATPQVMAAWQALYDQLTGIVQKLEKDMYDQLEKEGYEKGFVPFTITKKDTIASGPTIALTIKRQDGKSLPAFRSGQYITLRVQKDGVFHNGQYPLVELSNGSTYTVAFKQVNDWDQNHIISEEIISKYNVGSTVLVSPPAGRFALSADAKRHVFISGGIGITSFLAMVEELNQHGKAASATLFHCVRTQGHAGFGDKLQKILPQGQYIVLTQETPLSKAHLEGKVNADTHVYVAGSESFLTLAESALAGFNLPRSQVHVRSIEPTTRILQLIDQK